MGALRVPKVRPSAPGVEQVCREERGGSGDGVWRFSEFVQVGRGGVLVTLTGWGCVKLLQGRDTVGGPGYTFLWKPE